MIVSNLYKQYETLCKIFYLLPNTNKYYNMLVAFLVASDNAPAVYPLVYARIHRTIQKCNIDSLHQNECVIKVHD